MGECYDKRNSSASGKTISVVDAYTDFNHAKKMLGTKELLNTLETSGIAQADMARVLKLPSSRISEMYAGRRQIKLDEAKALVEAFNLDEGGSRATISEATARLLILHVASKLNARLSPDDELVKELSLDFQAFSKFARAHLPAPSPAETSAFLEGRNSDWLPPLPTKPAPRRNR